MTTNAIHLTAGMRQNLYSLQKTTQSMESTQSKLASGLRIQSALDDPINFFAAQGHRQRAGDLGQLKDAMAEAVQTVKAANNGIEAITDLIASAKSIAQSAKSAEGTGSAVELSDQYNSVLNQISNLASDSGYKGVNLLGGTSQELDVLFSENDTSSQITLQGFDASLTENGTASSLSLAGQTIAYSASAGGAETGWVTGTGSTGAISTTGIEKSIEQLDDARDALRTEAKGLASDLSTITIRQDFTSNMMNTLEDGAAELTEADMNEESANMLMLQTRQQLGSTSLSLASQAAQSVLRLF
ncbi:MAG: flagellin [Deltaproteobacteria bacterium]|nr:flagellin [Deltaproteobacteria bacterium]